MCSATSILAAGTHTSLLCGAGLVPQRAGPVQRFSAAPEPFQQAEPHASVTLSSGVTGPESPAVLLCWLQGSTCAAKTKV